VRRLDHLFDAWQMVCNRPIGTACQNGQ
jgi:hypothetical protein